jgi:hypothetical protein
MPRKVKPQIWRESGLSTLPGKPSWLCAPVVVSAMRRHAIDLMLRDMWCAAARELAERSER